MNDVETRKAVRDEEYEVEAFVDVLGNWEAQEAIHQHTFPEFVAAVQS